MGVAFQKSLIHLIGRSSNPLRCTGAETVLQSIRHTSLRRQHRYTSLLLPFQNYCKRRMATTTSTPITVPITFVYSDGEEVEVEAEVGKNYLHVAQANGIDLEGACGGELACATCHLIFDPTVYETLPPKAEEEDDMLDLAYGLTDTSRLGCQIIVTTDHSGIKVKIPEDGL